MDPDEVSWDIWRMEYEEALEEAFHEEPEQ